MSRLTNIPQGENVETSASGPEVIGHTEQVLRVHAVMRMSQNSSATWYTTHKQKLPFPGLISVHFLHEREEQLTQPLW